MSDKPPFDPGHHLVVPFFNYGFWAVLSPLVWQMVLRFRPDREFSYRKLSVWILAGILLSLFHEFSTNAIYYGGMYLAGNLELTSAFLSEKLDVALGGSFSRFVEYWMLFFGLTIWGYYQAFKKQKLKLAQVKAELFETKLEVLKAQLHPHFLFNTLNSVSSLMTKDIDKAQKVLSNLAQLLRSLFRHDGDHMVTLEQELEFIKNYLEIESIRFSDRLEVVYKIDPGTGRALVPRLILQPLVENSLKHGISKSCQGGRITLVSETQNGSLLLTVSDNGKGMKEQSLIWELQGVGLKNTRERLIQLYEDDQHIEINSENDQGFTIKLTIPFEED